MRKLILFIIASSLSFGAFNATVIWRTSAASGSNTNGGAFDPGVGSPGTDESTGSGTAITVTLVTGTTGTCSPSCTSTTHGPGNFIYIASGSGCNLSAWYEILSQAAGTITVDHSMGSGTDACVGTVGGPLATIAQAAAEVVAGNNVCVKADATYSIGTNIAISTAGGNGTPIVFQGYASTCGVSGNASDYEQATIQATSALTGLFTVTGSANQLRNFLINMNSETGTSRGITTSVALLVDNVIVENFATAGIAVTGGLLYGSNSRVTGGLSGCTAGLNLTGGTTIAFSILADTNNCTGIEASGTGLVCIYCIGANNIGGASSGIESTANVSTIFSCIGCMGYGNGNDGLLLTSAAVTLGLVRNSSFWGNTGSSIASSNALKQSINFDYNAYASGTLSNVLAGPHDVTLVADPTIAGASLNFAPNTSVVEGVGFPGILTTGGTGYVDIGPLQHKNPTGSGQVSYATAQ